MCVRDMGWMAVLDNANASCDWDYPASQAYPVFLYARNHKKTRWEEGLYYNKEGIMEMFYLTMYSMHFYLPFNGAVCMIKNYSDSENVNPLSQLHGLLFPISSKCSFTYTILWTE